MKYKNKMEKIKYFPWKKWKFFGKSAFLNNLIFFLNFFMNNKIKENFINCYNLFIFFNFSFSFPQINLKLHLILESNGKKFKKNGFFFFFQHLDTSEKMIRKKLLNKRY